MNELYNTLKGWMGLPMLASEHGGDVDDLIMYIHALMVVLFVGWMAFFFYALWRFRKSRHPRGDYHGAQTHASMYVEGAVALVEIILLLGFAIPLWAKVVDEFPEEAEAVNIKIIAQQFAWNSIYPGEDGRFGRQDITLASGENRLGIDRDDPAAQDDIVPPLNTVVVPVNTPVILHVSSLDVIHSFAVHPLRVTQDAIPGLSIPTHFTPTTEGEYMITCAQLCGNSHYSMRGFLRVVSEQEYQQWMDEQSATAGAAGGSPFE